jgi:hypothetical protein
VRISTSQPLTVRRGEPATIAFDLHNAGDTRWLHASGEAGWTRFGLHLHRADSARTLVDFDWVRVPLPRDVAPNDAVRIVATVPAIAEPGEYLAVADLVVEGVLWFADRGSVSVDVPITVRAPDVAS